jgi:hypothetical protein
MRRPRRLLGGLAALMMVGAAASPGPAGAASVTSLALRPNCGPPGTNTYSIEVIGQNLPPGQGEVVFNPGEGQQTFPETTPASGLLDMLINPHGVPAGTYGVTVESFHLESVVARALFVVPCPPTPSPSTRPPASPTPTPQQSPRVPTPTPTPPKVLNPTLTLSPAVGPPGTVTVARGTDFPANLPVQLAWSQGIAGTTQPSVVADASGSFSTVVLVFPHDELGTRVLTALSVTPPGSSLLGFASASFLVTPGAVQPRDFSWRR